MELRHLRYFVAVAEEGSLLAAAQRRLNTSQPSLSRQLRDLEAEIGVELLERHARGVVTTPAGQVFLDHARLALLQVEAAADGARRAAQPKRPALAMGFLVGLEVTWLPHLLRIIREEAPEIEITLSSQSSPELALALMRGKIGHSLPSAREAELRPNLQIISKGASDRRAAGRPSLGIAQKDSAARSCH